MSLKYKVQKFFGSFLSSPVIPKDKTTGYSLVRSERVECCFGKSAKVYAPFFLHGVTLGDYSYIARNAHVSHCEIGKFCSIGPNFCCGLGIHPINGISTSPMFYSTARQNGMTLCREDKVKESLRTVVGHDVFIGANVTVLDGVTIGDGAVIGAGAVVTEDIPPYAIAVGVPAKVKKYRFDENTIERLLEKKWWDWDADGLKQVEEMFFDVNRFLDL